VFDFGTKNPIYGVARRNAAGKCNDAVVRLNPFVVGVQLLIFLLSGFREFYALLLNLSFFSLRAYTSLAVFCPVEM
jgi:hypothetical protein